MTKQERIEIAAKLYVEALFRPKKGNENENIFDTFEEEFEESLIESQLDSEVKDGY